MEAAWALIMMRIVMILVLTWAWKIVNMLWLTPKRLERVLREQGLEGNSYRFLVGDMKEFLKARHQALLKPMNLFSHDIVPRVTPYFHHTLRTYGMFFHSSALPLHCHSSSYSFAFHKATSSFMIFNLH
ncbi:unnamed protein product [Sphenostylis stenocarpa]|uniref:Cytochrome P450 n=1 Tax=Sphenostylis stenocarpa TaxID=92480 RepID=A0AA86T0J4_9FABA|nr:unnamed protein product [Sphenostylis stenocarpa]